MNFGKVKDIFACALNSAVTSIEAEELYGNLLDDSLMAQLEGHSYGTRSQGSCGEFELEDEEEEEETSVTFF